MAVLAEPEKFRPSPHFQISSTGNISLNSAAVFDNSSSSTTFNGDTSITGTATVQNTSEGRLRIRDSGASINEKEWVLHTDGGVFSIFTANDAGSGVASAISIDRTGTTVDSVNLTATDVVAGGKFMTTGNVGFNNVTPIAKPTVSGSRGGNAALASLLTALANYRLITNSTSA